MKALEIGDIVTTPDGVKMVVNIFKNLSSREICCQCVDVDDKPGHDDLILPKTTYKRLELDLVKSPSRYNR